MPVTSLESATGLPPRASEASTARLNREGSVTRSGTAGLTAGTAPDDRSKRPVATPASIARAMSSRDAPAGRGSARIAESGKLPAESLATSAS